MKCQDSQRHKETYLDAGFPDPCVSECGTHGIIGCPKCLGKVEELRATFAKEGTK